MWNVTVQDLNLKHHDSIIVVVPLHCDCSDHTYRRDSTRDGSNCVLDGFSCLEECRAPSRLGVPEILRTTVACLRTLPVSPSGLGSKGDDELGRAVEVWRREGGRLAATPRSGDCISKTSLPTRDGERLGEAAAA